MTVIDYKGYRIEVCRIGKGWRASIFSPGSARNPIKGETIHDNAERSKPSPRIFGKRQRTSDDCGDNRGGVCLDGDTPFVRCRAAELAGATGMS